MDVVGSVFGLWNTLYTCNSMRHLCSIRPEETLLLPDPEMSLIKMWPNNNIVVLESCLVSLCGPGLNLDFGPVQG